MLENPYYYNEDAKEDRKHLRAWIGRVVMLLATLGLVVWATGAYAAPMAEASADGAKVTLTDEDCKLDAVANLKNRATWQEKGKTYEGCYGVHPDGFVLAYFADKTVVVIPVQLFQAVSGA